MPIDFMLRESEPDGFAELRAQGLPTDDILDATRPELGSLARELDRGASGTTRDTAAARATRTSSPVAAIGNGEGIGFVAGTRQVVIAPFAKARAKTLELFFVQLAHFAFAGQRLESALDLAIER